MTITTNHPDTMKGVLERASHDDGTRRCIYVLQDGTTCGRTIRARGLCSGHHRLEHGKPCGFRGCPDKVLAKGLCPAHWAQQHTGQELHETPSSKMPRLSGTSPLEWVLARINADATTGCWHWARASDRNGYVRASVEGRRQGIHRWVQERTFGPIPDGHEVDHACQVPGCISPFHTRVLTKAEHLEVTHGVRRLRRQWQAIPDGATVLAKELGTLSTLGSQPRVLLLEQYRHAA